MSAIQVYRQARRKFVKKRGMRTIRALWGFLGRQSLVGDKPVHDSAEFPWTRPLEANWHKIRAELDAVLAQRDLVPPFHEVSPDQYKISKGDDWKTFILFGFGHKSERNCARCPETTRLLEAIPSLQTAWFSILAPGYRVPPHRGVTKGIIRCHLGLKVPKKRENCYMRVAEETFSWEEGKCVVLDDTYDHEVRNDTPEERVVLLIDVDRPMRLPGRILSKVLLRLLKTTAYYQDGLKNLTSWEDRFDRAAERVDGYTIDSTQAGGKA